MGKWCKTPNPLAPASFTYFVLLTPRHKIAKNTHRHLRLSTFMYVRASGRARDDATFFSFAKK